MKLNISVRELNRENTPQALSFVWNVFSEYEAPDYTEEGVKEFYRSIHDEDYLSSLCIYGAFESDKLAGVIATRKNGTHIALFFVDGKYHRQGIGTKLFQTALKKCGSDKMTVNSSLYAAEVYHKFGFYDVDKEQTVKGIRFIPMELKV